MNISFQRQSLAAAIVFIISLNKRDTVLLITYYSIVDYKSVLFSFYISWLKSISI